MQELTSLSPAIQPVTADSWILHPCDLYLDNMFDWQMDGRIQLCLELKELWCNILYAELCQTSFIVIVLLTKTQLYDMNAEYLNTSYDIRYIMKTEFCCACLHVSVDVFISIFYISLLDTLKLNMSVLYV